MSVFCNAFQPKPIPQSRRARLEALVKKGQAFKGRIIGLQYKDSLCHITIQEIGQVADPVTEGTEHQLPLRTWAAYGPLGPTKRLLASVFKTPMAALDKCVYYEVDMESGNLVSLIPFEDPELQEV